MKQKWIMAQGCAVLMILLAVLLLLTGCPPGTSLALTSDGVQVSGNCYPYAGTTSGWRYVPIGGETTWTLLNPRDYDSIYAGSQWYIVPDSVPDGNISWTFSGWSQILQPVGKTVTVKAINSPYRTASPNTRCTFEDAGKPPNTDDPPNGSWYAYTDVVIPTGVQVLCAQNLNPSSGLDYALRIKLENIGGDLSPITWKHCTVKEFVGPNEPGTGVTQDSCGILPPGETPEWGDGGQVQDGNLFGDQLTFDVSETFRTRPYCALTFVTHWKISSGGPWHIFDVATYQYIYVNNNGVSQMDMKRNGISVHGDIPACL